MAWNLDRFRRKKPSPQLQEFASEQDGLRYKNLESEPVFRAGRYSVFRDFVNGEFYAIRLSQIDIFKAKNEHHVSHYQTGGNLAINVPPEARARAWEALIPAMVSNNVKLARVANETGIQNGMYSIVIDDLDRKGEPTNWQGFCNEVEATLARAGIAPSLPCLDLRVVKGSRYIACRDPGIQPGKFDSLAVSNVSKFSDRRDSGGLHR